MLLRFMIVASALMIAILSMSSADTYEPNMNRPGGDYKNFAVTSAGDCQTSCVQDAQCKAWTWVNDYDRDILHTGTLPLIRPVHPNVVEANAGDSATRNDCSEPPAATVRFI